MAQRNDGRQPLSSSGRWLRLIAAAAVLLVTAIALTRPQLSLTSLYASLSRLSPASLVASFSLVLAQLTFQYLRLRLLLPRPGAPGSLALARAYFTGQTLNVLLPARAGDLACAVGMAQGRRERIPGAIGVICAGKVAHGVGLGLLALPLAGDLRVVSPWAPRAILLAGAAVAALLLGARLWRRLWLRLRAWGRGWAAGFGVLARPATMLRSVAAAVAGCACEAASLQVVAHGMGVQLSFTAAAVAVLATNLAIIVPVTPANLGTFELGMTLALAGFGIDPAPAAAIALLHHGLVIVATGACYALLLPLRGRSPGRCARSPAVAPAAPPRPERPAREL